MPVSFFTLPPEIRNMVYSHLLVEPGGGNILAPTRERKPVRWSCPGISNINRSMALLRTCQAIYAESTAFLYGNNTFHFSDVWVDDQASVPGSLLDPYPWSGHATMHDFLKRIKPRNVLKLRHVRVSFGSLESILNIDLQQDPLTPPAGGTCCVRKALDLLAVNHDLATFDLVFVADYMGGTPWMIKKFCGPGGVLRDGLAKMKGVRELGLLTHSSWRYLRPRKKWPKLLKLLKREMMMPFKSPEMDADEALQVTRRQRRVFKRRPISPAQHIDRAGQIPEVILRHLKRQR